MGVTRKQASAVLAAAILIGGWFAWLNLSPQQLEFRDRAFPEGFRTLVLASGSSPFDPFVGLPRSTGRDNAPKPNTKQICEALFRDLGTPAIGKLESPVQIASFLDYRCPYCRKLADIMSKMQDGNVRIFYKEWPILGDGSVLAARAGLAADRQGKYLAFHLRLMNSRLIPTIRSLEETAAELGINVPQLRQDMDSDVTTRTIQRTNVLASALGFIGTPAMVVGRTIVQGEISKSELERLIEDEMRPSSAKAC
jgi:protein-disulfide isomerase